MLLPTRGRSRCPEGRNVTAATSRLQLPRVIFDVPVPRPAQGCENGGSCRSSCVPRGAAGTGAERAGMGGGSARTFLSLLRSLSGTSSLIKHLPISLYLLEKGVSAPFPAPAAAGEAQPCPRSLLTVSPRRLGVGGEAPPAPPAPPRALLGAAEGRDGGWNTENATLLLSFSSSRHRSLGLGPAAEFWGFGGVSRINLCLNGLKQFGREFSSPETREENRSL